MAELLPVPLSRGVRPPRGGALSHVIQALH
jgi:hypothetical protein